MQVPNLKEAQKRTKNPVNTYEYTIDPSLKKIGENKKYFIKTYGCQMNEHDSENIKAILEDMSYKEANDYENADLILLNTCAIRENAHNKVFGFLGRIKHLKKIKKDIIVGVCGCMAQEESVIEEILQKYKWLDLCFGTHNIYDLPNILNKAIKENKTEVDVFSIEGDIIENIPVKRENPYKAWVNIMYGCDKFCTYCIVPYTRGKQRSRKMEDILNEVKKLKEDGYLEVTLLGQNVNAYGKDLEYGYGMAELLENVAKTEIPRIRFVTSHPWDFTSKMIDIIRKYENIMPYIHLPLQSGSDRILKLMGRRYTKESYLNLFKELKEKIPNVSITTDIIVGFPGENEEDFNETLDVVKQCQYDSAYTFIFSPREGTPAAKMKDTISQNEKEIRLATLNKMVNECALLNNQKYLTKVVPVLVEGVSEKNDAMLMGYTDTMKLVNVEAPKEKIGQIVDVLITDVKTWSMDGVLFKPVK